MPFNLIAKLFGSIKDAACPYFPCCLNHFASLFHTMAIFKSYCFSFGSVEKHLKEKFVSFTKVRKVIAVVLEFKPHHNLTLSDSHPSFHLFTVSYQRFMTEMVTEGGTVALRNLVPPAKHHFCANRVGK